KTFEQFTKNCKDHGVWDLVTPIIDDSSKAWQRGLEKECDLLFIDGDHVQALRDFRQWSQFLCAGAVICFHDYCSAFPQVMLDVDGLIAAGAVEVIEQAEKLLICRLKVAPAKPMLPGRLPPPPAPPRAFPKKLYRWWVDQGMPLARPARFVRYRLLGWLWPVPSAPVRTPAGAATPPAGDVGWDQQFLQRAQSRIGNVAVVIPCHNYGKYLGEAIESVLTQTVLPREIVVVDDSSSDDTAAVAANYAGHGVRYMRGEWKSVAAARNAGAMATVAPFLVFLDADDRLGSNYIDACLRLMADSAVGIAYGDMQEFGEGKKFHCMPQFDRELLQKRNYISAHAMIRRQAFETVGGYRELNNAHQDWDIYKRITRLPWRAWKADTLVEYRVHKDSMLQTYSATQPTYAHRAGLTHEPITIFTPFAGRTEVFERYLHALRSLECDPSLVRIHWLDTSGKPEFEKMLRKAASELPFACVTYRKAPLPALWNQTPDKLIANRVSGADNARHFYQMAVVYVYNHMLVGCDTEFLMTIEDDIAPEPSTLRRMLECWREDTSAVVASYPCRFRDCQIVWSREGGKRMQFKERRSGVEEVSGSGFGCSLFRSSILRKQPIHYNGDKADGWYDDVAFASMRWHGKVLCNWDLIVEHMES
ncbi:MAG TPA: glycosyltransferase, partial [Candidatus Peribacteria bacterium]|nr:glycosyltransferase [Candidatus Peribacteria bacterium]